MAGACTLLASSASIAEGLVSYVDCHAAALGLGGFQSLAGGPLLPALLTGCLTIYVGLIGYRIVLGEGVGPREGLLFVVRAALVMTFCLSWPSYDAVVVKVVADGPGEIAKAVLAPSGVTPLGSADAAAKLEELYESIQLAAAENALLLSPTLAVDPLAATAQATQASPSAGATDTKTALTVPGVVLLVSALGPYLIVRLCAGLLLSIGPLVVALALFDQCLGLLEGWIRALFGVILGSLAAMLVTALEVGFLEERVAAASASDFGMLGGPGLLLIGSLFGLAGFGLLATTIVVALSFRFRRSVFGRGVAASRSSSIALPATLGAPSSGMIAVLEQPSRAQGVADAVVAQSNRGREQANVIPFAPSRSPRPSTGPRDVPLDVGRGHPPLGSTLRRTSLGRPGASKDRRDVRG